MKVYSLFIIIIIIIICYVCRCTSVKIKPELKKNILKFGYGINFKYKRMLAHSFDRSYVVTKFILPTINDLKFSTLNMMSDLDIYKKKKDALMKSKNIY